jgi:hypothetical protein
VVRIHYCSSLFRLRVGRCTFYAGMTARIRQEVIYIIKNGFTCRYGGIGRHGGFRHHWQLCCYASSSLVTYISLHISLRICKTINRIRCYKSKDILYPLHI